MASLRFWARFALMEYFNPRTKTKSQPPPPPKRFRRLRRRLFASRSFAPASRPNRAAVFATPHARKLARPPIRRFVSPFVSESEISKKQQARQAPLSAKACLCTRAHAFLQRNGNTLHRRETFTNARTGRPSASISTTIGARNTSFRPPTQKQAASVPRADRTASIHRATSRQRQRTFAVGGTFRPQSSYKNVRSHQQRPSATQASRSDCAFCQ